MFLYIHKKRELLWQLSSLILYNLIWLVVYLLLTPYSYHWNHLPFTQLHISTFNHIILWYRYFWRFLFWQTIALEYIPVSWVYLMEVLYYKADIKRTLYGRISLSSTDTCFVTCSIHERTNDISSFLIPSETSSYPREVKTRLMYSLASNIRFENESALPTPSILLLLDCMQR